MASIDELIPDGPDEDDLLEIDDDPEEDDDFINFPIGEMNL